MSLAIDEVEESFNTFQDLQTAKNHANNPTTGRSLICLLTTDQHFLTTLPINNSSSTIIPSTSYGHVTSPVTLQQPKFATCKHKNCAVILNYLTFSVDIVL